MEKNETHEKIINVLKEKGPGLPINIAKSLGMSSLFISAFLSELFNEKRVKMSHLKVGGSSLYYLEGQEEKLEPFYKFLHPKEAEAFLLLKKSQLLKDSEQDPAIRVALRSIRDFSVGFKINEEIYWKYILLPDSDIESLLKQPSSKKETKLKPQKIKKETTKSQKSVKIKEKDFINPLILEEKKKKEKPKSEFVLKVINFLNKNNLPIIEEKEYKSKEYNCIIKIKSELGNLEFLTQAKDKKTISEADLKKLLSNSQSIPLPAFLIYTGEISKKGKEYLIKYKSILKAKKID